MRILVVEDDPSLGRQLEDRLTSEGYAVELATDGAEAQFLGETEPYDVVVLDLGLPRRDGLSVLRAWRGEGNAVPVLILTARDHWHDKVQGIDAGADDYLAKPFHLRQTDPLALPPRKQRTAVHGDGRACQNATPPVFHNAASAGHPRLRGLSG